MQPFMWISVLALGAVSAALVSIYLFIMYCTLSLPRLRLGNEHDSQTPFQVLADYVRKPAGLPRYCIMISRKILEHHGKYNNFYTSDQRRIYIVCIRRSIGSGYSISIIGFRIGRKRFLLFILYYNRFGSCFDTEMKRSQQYQSKYFWVKRNIHFGAVSTTSRGSKN